MKQLKPTLFRIYLFAFILIVGNGVVSGQTLTSYKEAGLKGSVNDSTKNTPIEYATVILQDSLGKGLKSTFTDSLGRFNFSDLSFKTYKIQVISMGFINKSLTVRFSSPVGNQLSVGTILLAYENVNLKEVLITNTRPIIKQQIDGITYDLQADPESKVKSVLDMMRKIPMINVDGEDNIQLKGNANYRILINGKPSSLMARSPKDALRSMSASNIQKIEVLTTPPAKYDGEGLAGIINIITNKNIDNGYNGNINSYYKFPVGGLTTSGSINIKRGKFGANVFAGVSATKSPESARFNNRNTSGVSPTILAEDRINNFNAPYRALSADLSYEIDSLNLLSGRIVLNNGSYTSHNVQNTVLSETNHSLIESYTLNNTLRNPFSGIDFGVNYEMGFKKKKNKLLTLSYNHTRSSDDMDYQLNIEKTINYDNPNFTQINNSKANEQTVQLDYYNPFKGLTAEGGVKAIFRHNESDFRYSTFNELTSQFDIQDEKSNLFNNNQNVYSIYNSYQVSIHDVTIKAGLRLEETMNKSHVTNSINKIKNDYLNLIPSLSSSWKFDKNRQSLNIGYTRRIQRPNIWNLNPFVDRSNPNFEIAGNPFLIPVKSNNLSINYNNQRKVALNIGLSYAFANNTIQQISVYNDSTRITRTTYDNIGKDRLIASDFNVNYPISSSLTIGAGGNLGYIWLEGVVDGELIRSKGLKGNAFARGTVTINKGFHFNADVKYQSADITLQGRFNPFTFTSFSLDKSIFSDKFTLSGNVSNPFSKYRTFQRISTGNNFIQTSTNINYFRSFTFSLNYKFGKTTNTVKGVQRKINNDDSTGRKITN